MNMVRIGLGQGLALSLGLGYIYFGVVQLFAGLRARGWGQSLSLTMVVLTNLGLKGIRIACPY